LGRHQYERGNKEQELLTGTINGSSIILDVYLPTRVAEPDQLSRDNGDGVAIIVHPCKLRDLRVEVLSPGDVANARGRQRGAADRRALREVKLEEERVEFRKSCTQ